MWADVDGAGPSPAPSGTPDQVRGRLFSHKGRRVALCPAELGTHPPPSWERVDRPKAETGEGAAAMSFGQRFCTIHDVDAAVGTEPPPPTPPLKGEGRKLPGGNS